MKHRWKRPGPCWLAVLLAAGTLTACSPEEAASSTLEEANQLRLENDGEEASLVVAERFFSTERTAALEEIAEKYMADFPQTRIEIVTVESGEEAMGMLQSGEADLVELSEQEQPAAVEQGLLTELSPYLDVWEERSTLTARGQTGRWPLWARTCYLLPATLNQDLVYYRSDWFEEFNQGKEEGLVYCRIWEDFADAQQKLQDKGAAGLVFGGKDRLVDLFDSILWSAVSLGRMEDPAASYLSAVDENDTLFTLEQAARRRSSSLP